MKAVGLGNFLPEIIVLQQSKCYNHPFLVDYRLLALVFLLSYRRLKCEVMNILKIVVALICAYGLFVSISYLLMRLLFPKIKIEEADENLRPAKARMVRRMNRPMKRQKNLAF